MGGAQLAVVDTTLVSPLTSSSQPRRRAGQYEGAALQDVRKSKERTYPELLRSRQCRLVVLALETGGRWSPEATTFLRLLAQTKARAVPNILRKAVEASLLSRWSAILAHAAPHAFAASLLDLDCAGTSTTDGDTPSISQLHSEAPLPPRVPAVSQPAPKELRLGFGPAIMHIRSCRYRNGIAWRMPSKTVIVKPSAEKRCGGKKTAVLSTVKYLPNGRKQQKFFHFDRSVTEASWPWSSGFFWEVLSTLSKSEVATPETPETPATSETTSGNSVSSSMGVASSSGSGTPGTSATVPAAAPPQQRCCQRYQSQRWPSQRTPETPATSETTSRNPVSSSMASETSAETSTPETSETSVPPNASPETSALPLQRHQSSAS